MMQYNKFEDAIVKRPQIFNTYNKGQFSEQLRPNHRLLCISGHCFVLNFYGIVDNFVRVGYAVSL